MWSRALVAMAVATAGLAVALARPATDPKVVTDTVLLRAAGHASEQAIADLALSLGWESRGRLAGLPDGNVFVLHAKDPHAERDGVAVLRQKGADTSTDKDALLATLQAHPLVHHAEYERHHTHQPKHQPKQGGEGGEDEEGGEQCGIVLPDPLWLDQWHLCNTGQQGGTPGMDANLAGAWQLGYHGEGITIGIVDDGLEHTHPDLVDRYVPELSYDFNELDNDPAPGDDNYHGTSCAGVAVASPDSTCGVGAAFAASVAGLRLIAGPSSTALELQALSYHTDEIHVYSNSWGPSDCGLFGCSMGGMANMLRAQIAVNVLRGRGGKGNVYLWAAGNGGGTDNTNYDMYANNPHVIAVAACNDQGHGSSYSEPGACIHVCGPSSDSGRQGITTTDRLGSPGYSEGNCTDSFGGTSSATPLVAGVVALMLSANPDLTWRDVKYILKETATHNHPESDTWVENAAGVQVSHRYGFGLVNAAGAVALARTWTPVNGMLSFQSTIEPNRQLGRHVNTFELSVALPSPPTPTLASLEMVALRVWASCAERGSVVITLRSPGGTVSYLSLERPDAKPDLEGWEFTSSQHWGEAAAGTWIASVQDSAHPDTTVTKLQLVVYGAADQTFVTVCGDGQVGYNEVCDDGNTNSGDGCDDHCYVERGWVCANDSPSQASVCTTTCGDGMVVGDEECDDDNTRSGDGCDAECKVEEGFSCSSPPRLAFTSLCLRPGQCNGRVNLTESEGTITDGSGFHSYANNQYCQFLIVPSTPAAAIALTFTELSVEGGYDTVTVYDGMTEDAPVLAVLTGEDIPMPFLSSQGEAVLVVFESDPSAVQDGFTAHYTALDTSLGCSSRLLTDPEGVITDGSGEYQYPPRTRCNVTIAPDVPADHYLSLSFTDMRIGHGSTLRVYSHDTLLGEFSESAIPHTFLSVGDGRPSLRIAFEAGDGVGEGWRAVWSHSNAARHTCQAMSVFEEDEGTFNDGSDGFVYEPNAQCSFLIQPHATADWIEVTLAWHDLADDVLTVYDGASTDSAVLAHVTGSSFAPTVLLASQAQAVLLTFASNASLVGDGFEVSYRTGSGAHTCSGTVHITTPSGNITDGSGASPYNPNSHCVWELDLGVGFEWVAFTFADFDLESGYDTLTFYEGSTSGEMAAQLSGSSAPMVVVMSSRVTVVFASDGSVQRNGFSLHFAAGTGEPPQTMCRGISTFTTAAGTIRTNPVGTQYEDFADCAFLIAPQPAHSFASIALQVTTLDTELLYDGVFVYDGPSANDPLLLALTGSVPLFLHVAAPSSEYVMAVAARNTQPLPAPISATLAVPSVSDACSSLPPHSLANAIALVRRGGCTFEDKIVAVAAAGGVGVIVYNNEDGGLIAMSVDAPALPSVFVSLTSGARLVELIAQGDVTVEFTDTIRSSSSAMFVEFVSDETSEGAYSGFVADFTAEPTGISECTAPPRVVTASVGVLILTPTNCSALLVPDNCGLPASAMDVQVTSAPPGVFVDAFDGPSMAHPVVLSASESSAVTTATTTHSNGVLVSVWFPSATAPSVAVAFAPSFISSPQAQTCEHGRMVLTTTSGVLTPSSLAPFVVGGDHECDVVLLPRSCDGLRRPVLRVWHEDMEAGSEVQVWDGFTSPTLAGAWPVGDAVVVTTTNTAIVRVLSHTNFTIRYAVEESAGDDSSSPSSRTGTVAVAVIVPTLVIGAFLCLAYNRRQRATKAAQTSRGIATTRKRVAATKRGPPDVPHERVQEEDAPDFEMASASRLAVSELAPYDEQAAHQWDAGRPGN